MTPLEEIVRRRIDETGPLPVAEYMELALGHPRYGYYVTRDPFGSAGDFVTAPEISQVFGELIGLWSAVTWQQIGRPARTLLVECGPGRGTLMADAMRAAAAVPDFLDTVEIHLVETSPALRARQRAALPAFEPRWHRTLDAVPPGPAIVIANEFLDALPVRQLVRTGDGWAERCVGLANGGFAFVTGAPADDAGTVVPPGLAGAPAGSIFETCPAAHRVVGAIAGRIAAHGGAALISDYGHARSACGDTLQAVRRHAYVDPLAGPGDADLTAHVDFEAMAAVARDAGAATAGPVGQRAFLISLGILQRTERLARRAPQDKAEAILSGTNRLIDADDMGTLFKMMAVTGADAPLPAGFESR